VTCFIIAINHQFQISDVNKIDKMIDLLLNSPKSSTNCGSCRKSIKKRKNKHKFYKVYFIHSFLQRTTCTHISA